MKGYFLVFAIGFALSYFMTPFAEKIAFKLGAVDYPNERKIHKRPIPRMGGIAIYFAFFLSFLGGIFYFNPGWQSHLFTQRELLGIFLGATIITLFGVADDFRSLSPTEKFIGQILAASILIFFGVQIDFIGNPLSDGLISLGFWSVPLTLFWIVGMINTVNFIDGLDGLASGICGISSFAFFAFSHQTGQVNMAVLSIALAGSSLGFLRHNFYPAKIFMGDSGSMLLGFLLGAVTVQGVMKTIAAIAFLVPLIVMGIPILDTAFAIFRRYKSKRPITEADKEHIHHRLLHKGLSHRQAVVLIYIWSAFLSLIGLVMRFATLQIKVTLFLVLGVLSFWLLWYLGILEEFIKK